MTTSDLILHLVEELIHKEKELNQLATDKAQNNSKPDDKKQNEA